VDTRKHKQGGLALQAVATRNTTSKGSEGRRKLTGKRSRVGRRLPRGTTCGGDVEDTTQKHRGGFLENAGILLRRPSRNRLFINRVIFERIGTAQGFGEKDPCVETVFFAERGWSTAGGGAAQSMIAVEARGLCKKNQTSTCRGAWPKSIPLGTLQIGVGGGK